MNPFDPSPYRALYEIPARSINRSKLEGSVNLMGESGPGFSAEQGARVPAERLAGRILLPIPHCRQRRACGLRSRKLAEDCGAAVSLTWAPS